jgi:type II secretory pathway component PulF
MALRAADNTRFGRHAPAVTAAVGRGEPLSEAFAATGVFPRPFLDHLEVAEESGTIVESMDRLSRQYEQEGRDAAMTLARVAAMLVWGAIVAVIVLLVFRLFGFYLGTINEALRGI